MTWTTADIPDLTGSIAVVTGANGGLGLEVTRALSGAGAHVVMAARNTEKAQAARTELAFKDPDASLQIQPLDLASLTSVKDAASQILKRHPSIDILVNNAGVMGVPYATTDDGFERQFGTNHLGPFAFTALLWPALSAGLGGTTVAVTSFARHFRGRFDPDNPPLKGGYDPWKSYGQSKMANLRFALETDRRVRQSGGRVTSVIVHPGLTHTDLQTTSARESNGGASQRFWSWLASRAGMAPARGALPIIRAVTDPNVRGGWFISPRWVTAGSPVRRPLAPWTRRSTTNQVLWETSERLTGIPFEVA